MPLKKAYLTGAKNKQLEAGDILLFYRSHDNKEVTSLGVLEEVYYDMTDPDSISRIVGKRSVFTRNDIQEMAETPTTILLFRWHFEFEDPVGYDQLKDHDILSAPLQVMQEISSEDYKCIQNLGGINERFALD